MRGRRRLIGLRRHTQSFRLGLDEQRTCKRRGTNKLTSSKDDVKWLRHSNVQTMKESDSNTHSYDTTLQDRLSRLYILTRSPGGEWGAVTAWCQPNAFQQLFVSQVLHLVTEMSQCVTLSHTPNSNSARHHLTIRLDHHKV